MNAALEQILLAAPPAILAITLHEAAHGYAALALGDTTARDLGRLSLNPLRHIDRVGTLLLPGILLVGQLLTMHHVGFMFGWAKPVPVSNWRFRDPRRGMAVVAAAGPACNFVQAWIAALLLHAVAFLPAGAMIPAADFLQYAIITNVVLALFNLLPIPPLDGGRIAVGVLPLPLARAWARLERAGLAVILLFMFLLPWLLRGMGITFDPLGAALNQAVPAAINIVFHLAGYDTHG